MLNSPILLRMIQRPPVHQAQRPKEGRSVTLLRQGLVLLVALCTATPARTQVTRFHVLRADDVIGHVIASRQAMPDGEVYAMVSHCEVDMVWKQVIRTSLRTEYAKGELTACHTSLRVNDAIRDSSSMVRGGGDCFVHPKAPFDCDRSTQWTTSKLYFEEPAGQSVIFVESMLKECPLVRTAPGTYTLTFPNGHVNHYVYRDGVLHEIRVDRALMDLVFRRA